MSESTIPDTDDRTIAFIGAAHEMAREYAKRVSVERQEDRIDKYCEFFDKVFKSITKSYEDA